MSESAKIGTSFAATPTWILRADGLSRGAKHLYAVLASYANVATKKCCPSLTTLSTDCQANRRTVLRWVEELKSAGAIEVSSGGGRAPNQYLLFTKPGHALSGDDTATGDTRDTGAVTPEPRQQWPNSHCSGDMGATAAVTPEPLELERSKRETEKAETTLSPLPLSKPKNGESDLEAESKSQSDLEAFDNSLPVEPPPAQTIRPKPQPIRPASRLAPQPIDPDEQKLNLLTSAVFSAFVLTSKSPALTGRWQNPTFDQRDRVMLALKPWASDETLTVKSIHALVKFASKDEFWRSRAHKPDSFVKNLESLIVAFNHALEAQSA